MRFAFLLALKYLIPRRKQLSVSIISLVSFCVISLVVWLAILFLSVTEGIEKKWLEELTTLSPPMRIRPTEAYYNSYYYLVDSIAQKSNYTLKTLGEKLQSEGDPYDPTADVEPPRSFPQPVFNADGSLKDLVKEIKETLTTFETRYPGFRYGEFEAGFGQVHLNLLRGETETLLTQVSYIVAFDKKNRHFDKLLLTPREEDLDHLAKILSLAGRSETAHFDTYIAQKENLPSSNFLGEGILLPKSFQKNKVLVGDKGHISYYTTSTTGTQEQRLPVYVAGFYDPGMMPLGNKMIFADPKVPAMLKGNIVAADDFFGNGFSLFLDNIKEAHKVKEEIQSQFDKRGLTPFFTIEAYSDYEFSRPFLEQLHSDKNLFTLISIIILLVACSNIVSMLLLLVNDKKKEIAVLQSMGATPMMILSIFGICGWITGALSSFFGSLLAFFTLRHLDVLINLLSFLQGHQAFQAVFYGNNLPNTLSPSVVLFIMLATFIVSSLAGIIPALKAIRISPSQILRAE